MTESAADRVRRRVRELLDRPRRSQGKLAEKLGLDRSSLSKKLTEDPDKQQDFTLRQLDIVATYLGVPPAALLQDDASEVWELSPSERELVRHFREWPADVQGATLSLLFYFAGLSPLERELRRFYAKYRRLTRSDREYAERTIDELLRVARIDARRTAAAETAPAPAARADSASQASRPKKLAGAKTNEPR